MKELKDQIALFIKNSKGDKRIIEAIQHDKSLVPFTTENKLLAYFLSIGELSFEAYSQLCQEYYQRIESLYPYLSLFDLSPRTFGQTWGEQHIRKIFPEFVQATKKNLANRYPQFHGEFDLWVDGIRVEVKACRAISPVPNGSISGRAYAHAEATAANFKYHYQQLKPSCCDIFIWIGVCKDELIYWVLTSEELQQTGKLGSQHRTEHTGVEGAEVFEGQVFMTEEELQPFFVLEADLLNRVKEKAKR